MPDPSTSPIEIQQIMRLLPHRYPFLLIDRVLQVEPRQRIVCLKNVTANEPQFTGHFPDFPLMPGVLIIEAIAQAGGALLLNEIPDRDGKLMVFTGIDGAKFRKPVTPGDQLIIEVTVLNWRSTAVRMRGTATVDGKLACEATVMCQLVPRPGSQTANAATLPAKVEKITDAVPAARAVEDAASKPTDPARNGGSSGLQATESSFQVSGALAPDAAAKEPAQGEACRPDPLAVSDADAEAAV
ncbi:3-hydroxyacyl-ACP dehydratase FabZ [Terriglobus sp.]|uniref:3-hydroxyacyl-ACP dehydratase FabZ n=1 Tax=Terriglobus sp. TaxID=1889013 RepID=UPI003AFF801C